MDPNVVRSTVVELLGYRFHRTKQQMARDAERLNALVIDGFTPFQFTYDQVVSQPTRTGRLRPQPTSRLPSAVRANPL